MMGKFEKCSNEDKFTAHKHQKKIAEILEEMDKKEKFSTLVSVPTGGGKTKIAIDFCIGRLEGKENKVLWMADRLLWSSIFVTLVAKKYQFSVMMLSVP
ncbi:hypothetical protein D3Z36_07020, partial [Lachnospiraceae bacterium]|nr:hypothetical protein [Lachnospiraceae bacterium]